MTVCSTWYLACLSSFITLCFLFYPSFSLVSETRGGDSALHGGSGRSAGWGKCFIVRVVFPSRRHRQTKKNLCTDTLVTVFKDQVWTDCGACHVRCNINGDISTQCFVAVCCCWPLTGKTIKFLFSNCDTKHTFPGSPSGLHYLHGSTVQSIRLRDTHNGGWRPEHPARHSGEIHQMWTHPAHALHAGHVQQRNKGTELLQTACQLLCGLLAKLHCDEMR